VVEGGGPRIVCFAAEGDRDQIGQGAREDAAGLPLPP
jgi:hypothetical protein